jgi:5-methyltetrahydrofolate--homocysteine methyltransferase
MHTAVKIEQNYTNAQTVHVLDASRSVTVVESLLAHKKEAFVKAVKEEYEMLRERHKSQQSAKSYISLAAAQKNKVEIDWDASQIDAPKNLEQQVFDNFDLKELLPYLDWTPFFQTWEMAGKYPKILEDKVVGTEAQKLFDDAKAMLEKIQENKWLTAKATFQLFPANAVGDDIEIYTDENRSEVKTKLHFLRQQNKKAPGRPNFSLADYIAPKDSGKQDYMGAFVVTAGLNIDEQLEKYKADHDDYNSIMLKALADRLAEAFAEYLHEKVRKEYWAYDNSESLSNEDLIREKYNGIRPAPGYPACPEHTEKGTLWKLLDVENKIGVQLTDSYAMWPAASVSGWYFAHPESKYFGLGKIAKDQVHNYAERKGWTEEEAEKWLSSVVNY